MLALCSTVIIQARHAADPALESSALAAEYQAAVLAESGLRIARKLLAHKESDLYDVPQSSWAQGFSSQDLQVEIRPANAGLTLAPYWSEAKKEQQALTRALRFLFLQKQIDPEMALKIKDWIDSDQREDYIGAENVLYLQTAYQPRQGRPETLEELLLVPGMRELGGKWLRRHLSIWPQELRLNINFVSAEVFQALFPELSEHWAAIEHYRKFKGFKHISQLREAVPGLRDEQFVQAVKRLTVQSKIYVVHAEARVRNTLVSRRFILESREYGSGYSLLQKSTLNIKEEVS
jgi:type II secretory pathway component PulK